MFKKIRNFHMTCSGYVFCIKIIKFNVIYYLITLPGGRINYEVVDIIKYYNISYKLLSSLGAMQTSYENFKYQVNEHMYMP